MLLVGIPGLAGWGDEIAANLDGVLHTAQKGGRLGVGWQQTGDRPATFGDKDLFSAALHFIKQTKTPSLELTGGDLLFHTMVILPWSLRWNRYTVWV